MYALARDWVKPKYYRVPPSKRQCSTLPPPSRKWTNIDQKGQYHSPLVPPQPAVAEPQNPNLTTKEELLREHKKRWGKVASRWRLQSKGTLLNYVLKYKFYQVNDRRYAESYKQLHEMAKNLLAYDD